MKTEKIFEDEAENKLFKRFIKSRAAWQISAKNREGKLVTESEMRKLAKKAGIFIPKKLKKVK